MTEPDPSANDPPVANADWESFYANYRKPGYVEGFEIQQKLGGGMFGLVFKARRMSIGKDYAIKFLQVDDVEVRRAVLSELEQVKYFAQIDHPNLVAIEDRGVVDGIPFLVMAYAGSETLRDRMPVDADGKGRAPTADEKHELLSAFLQCCRGLQALHERSLVHFDIKPANVFLKGAVARLGDYGLSKLVTHSRGSLSMGRGTPYYMAPEMLQRRGDARSDVYSLGVMLYELLCGKVPFAGDSEWEVLKKHETATPSWPSHLTRRERGVLERCLQKDPAQRFASVQELIVALGAPMTAGAAAMAEPAAAASGPGAGRRRAAGEKTDAERAESRDAFQAMAEASREALRHAGVVTRHAVRDAQRAARTAGVEAQKWWQRSVRETRGFGLRRLEAMQRLRRQKKSREGRERAARVAGAHRGRHGWRGALWMTGTLLVAALVLAAFWLSLAREAYPPAYTTSSVVYDAPVPTRSADASTFRHFEVPSPLTRLVSVSEPPWAAMAASDPSRARRLLTDHIEKLRRNAPIAPDERSQRRLPKFRVAEAGAALDLARHRVEILLRNPQYDPVLAGQIVSLPQGLVALAEAMAALRWNGDEDVRSAERLQRALREATGCRDLELYESTDLGHCAMYNRPLGALWLWFVNEFAHTERAWRVYRELLDL